MPHATLIKYSASMNKGVSLVGHHTLLTGVLPLPPVAKGAKPIKYLDYIPETLCRQ